MRATICRARPRIVPLSALASLLETTEARVETAVKAIKTTLSPRHARSIDLVGRSVYCTLARGASPQRGPLLIRTEAQDLAHGDTLSCETEALIVNALSPLPSRSLEPSSLVSRQQHPKALRDGLRGKCTDASLSAPAVWRNWH